MRIEKESGAWIKVFLFHLNILKHKYIAITKTVDFQIEQGSFPGVWEWERVVNIFGPCENVNKAKLLI